MKRYTFSLLPILVSACGPLGCSPATPRVVAVEPPASGGQETTPTPAEPAPAQPSQEPAAAMNATDGFSLSLWKARNTSGNDIISPINVETALAMTYAGARGETALEMGRVLGALQDAADPEREAAYHARSGARHQSLTHASAEGFELHVANRVFAAQDLHVEPAFGARMQSSYGSPLEQIDFAAPTAVTHINEWIAQQTRRRIENLIPRSAIDGSTRMVLTSAIYMKAKWMNSFTREATSPAVFHAVGGDVNVPTMHQTSAFPYAEESNVELLQLPYQGGRFAAVIALPKSDSSLAAVEAQLSQSIWQRWTTLLDAGPAMQRISLSLPKFRIEPGTADLVPALQHMGMRRAFAGNAEFAGIAPEALTVSGVLHKAFIEVDEAGTEAAAATAVIMVRSMAMLDEPRSFTADRPFLFFVRDTQDNSIVFMARVVNPAA